MDDDARLIATLAHLREPFERKLISKLPATTKRPALDYVGHAAVTDRLNRYAPGWSYHVEPVVVGFDDGPHVVAVFGEMTVCGVSRQEVGAVDSPSTYGQELKEAISDFIRRAAMRFGVALDLWSKEDLTSGTPTAPNAGTAGHAVPAPASGPEGYGEGSDGPANVEGEAPAPAGGSSGNNQGSEASPSHAHVWAPSPKLRKYEICTVEGCMETRRKSAA